MSETRESTLTLEQLRDCFARRVNEYETAMRDNMYRAPELQIQPESYRIMYTRKCLYEELIAIIDRGELPE